MKATIQLKIMGCRLNHAEGAFIQGALERQGYSFTIDPATTPDYVIIHTCTITAQAQREAQRLVRGYLRAGVRGVIVSGCAASTDKTHEFEANGAAAVVANSLGEVRHGSNEEANAIADRILYALTHGAVEGEYMPSFASTRASIKIQDGCNFRCAYCIVPDARGEPRSRGVDDILAECDMLLSKGFRELVLTGVNAICWHADGLNLCGLIKRVAADSRVGRIRLGSIEPRTTERELIELMADPSAKLCQTLHYPLQSGSNNILKLMRRHYTREQYCEVVEAALETLPQIGLGSDIITGFPGETEQDFADTVEIVEKFPFSNLHVFPYSERPGTPAATLPHSVPMDVRRNRAKQLIAIGERKRREFVINFVGKSVEVLVERVDENGVGRGWTSEYLEVRISGCSSNDVGRLISVVPHEAQADMLYASITSGN